MAASQKTPKSRPETLERRRDILRAALDTFGAKGFNKAPLSEIAEQVDMTHAGVLHHFGSKNQLLLEVLRFRDDAFQRYFQSPEYRRMVEAKFGAATRREIEAMTAHRLERRFAA